MSTPYVRIQVQPEVRGYPNGMAVQIVPREGDYIGGYDGQARLVHHQILRVEWSGSGLVTLWVGPAVARPGEEELQP